MQINKMKLSAIFAIVLMITSVMMIATPSPAKAALAATQPVSGALPAGTIVNDTLTTTAQLSFSPNPIGLGQALLVNMWINPSLASNNRLIPQGFIITITKPDGTKDVRTMDSEPATGAAWFNYYPDQVGTWSLQFQFIGTYFPAGIYYNGVIVTTSNSSTNTYGSAYYKPSSTGVQNLTVQQNFVYSWPPSPLPTDYWTRPASLNNRDWWPILGNYPSMGYFSGGPTWDALYPDTNVQDSYGTGGTGGPDGYCFYPWVQAPNTAHIVWSQQTATGIAGLIGGPAGIGELTSNPGSPSVIYSGRCYQTMTVPINGVPTSCAVSYDLRTGQQYYAIPIAQGGVTPTQIAYLAPTASGTTIGSSELGAVSWSVELLTISGAYLIKVNPVTGAITGNYSIDPLQNNKPLYTNQMDGYFTSFQDLGASAGAARYRLINWTSKGSSTTIASRIISNISWAYSQNLNTYTSSVGVEVCDFTAGIAAYVVRANQVGSGILWGLTINATNIKTGQALWTATLPDEGSFSAADIKADHGKVAILLQDGTWVAYDLYTGALAWKSEKMAYPWASTSFAAYASQSAYGMLFLPTYDGVYAFNWTNGKIVWTYRAPTYAAFETPYIENGTGEYSFEGSAKIADGKMYIYNTEHTPTYPLARGWGIHCINITTGEGIWTLDNPMTPGGIADGYLTASNGWDGTMYVLGKGLSATTVTAPNVVIPKGSGVVIQGTVLDQSPAQTNTPCVSKDSMQTQMQYLHLQQPIAGIWDNLTITGVPVTLQAIDSSNKVIEIGTTTTNGYYGTFGFTWTPPSEGQYTILAAFAGDDSYGSSGAATTVSVSAATPTPTPVATAGPINAATPTDLMNYIVAGVIAIIIAIAIVGIVIVRKIK